MYTQHLSHARASSHDETHITTGKSWRQSILIAPEATPITRQRATFITNRMSEGLFTETLDSWIMPFYAARNTVSEGRERLSRSASPGQPLVLAAIILTGRISAADVPA
jgi:hypothetical protein